jgi:DNA-binding NarL/FixJ family response regulator
MLRIVIADDHEVVRRGVRDLLSHHSGWEIVGEARTGRRALDLARHARPDVLVLDLSLPELSGMGVIQHVRAELPGVQVCVFSLHEDESTVLRAIAVGARGYVGKSERGLRLIAAIEALERHEPYLSPQAAEVVVRALVQGHVEGRRVASLEDPLTAREWEVAQLLVHGLGARALASRLGIGTKTVDTHRAAIMRKLGLRTMADLVRHAIRGRLTEP